MTGVSSILSSAMSLSSSFDFSWYDSLRPFSLFVRRASWRLEGGIGDSPIAFVIDDDDELAMLAVGVVILPPTVCAYSFKDLDLSLPCFWRNFGSLGP